MRGVRTVKSRYLTNLIVLQSGRLAYSVRATCWLRARPCIGWRPPLLSCERDTGVHRGTPSVFSTRAAFLSLVVSRHLTAANVLDGSAGAPAMPHLETRRSTYMHRETMTRKRWLCTLTQPTGLYKGRRSMYFLRMYVTMFLFLRTVEVGTCEQDLRPHSSRM